MAALFSIVSFAGERIFSAGFEARLPVICSIVKIPTMLLLLMEFRDLKPPEE
jgi:hypothetical protein